MPAIRHSSKRKAPPNGYSDIEDSLLVYSNKMKDAIAAPPSTGPRHQATWEITQINHQRSRYVWDMYCEEKISKALYDWCVKNGQCDATLVAKWKKEGYEKLCCLKCVQTKETNFNSTFADAEVVLRVIRRAAFLQLVRGCTITFALLGGLQKFEDSVGFIQWSDACHLGNDDQRTNVFLGSLWEDSRRHPI
ncbi:Protein BUD31 -like protein [Botrytis cinerea]